MIVVPGGGFRTLMMSYEGVDIARRLNARRAWLREQRGRRRSLHGSPGGLAAREQGAREAARGKDCPEGARKDSQMNSRTLGNSRLAVSALGYVCMGLEA